MSDKLTKEWKERSHNPGNNVIVSDGGCKDFHSLKAGEFKGCEFCSRNHMCQQKPSLGFSQIQRCITCEKEMDLCDSFGLSLPDGSQALIQFYVCWDCKLSRRVIY